MFDVRLRLYSDTGQRGRVLPTLGFTFTAPESATSTLRFSVSEKIAGRLDAPFIVGVEYSTGGAWLPVPRNNLFIASEEEGDAADVAGSVTFVGVNFLSFLLMRTYLHWSVSAKDGRRQWIQFPSGSTGSATPGHTLAGMLTESKNRGWGPQVTWAFTALKDSFGNTWPLAGDKLLWEAWQLGTPLSTILDRIVSMGFCEWWSEGLNLVLTVPGAGVDRTGQVILGGPGYTRAPGKASFMEAFTHLTIIPEEGNWAYATNTGANERFGRLEATMTQSGVSTRGGNARALALARPALRAGRGLIREQSYEWLPTDMARLPFVDFQVGDQVKVVVRGGAKEVQRVVGLVITKDDTSISVRAITGHKLLTAALKAQKKAVSVTVGGAVGGTGNAFPALPRPAATEPAPVLAVTAASNVGYFREDGSARAKVKLTWPAVTVDAAGAEITIDLYEVWYRLPDSTGSWTASAASPSLTLDLPAGQVVKVKARACSAAKVWGDFSPELDLTPAVPVLTLPAPAAPDLTSELSAVIASWDGLLGGAAPAPGFKHVVTEMLVDTTWQAVGQPMTAAGQSVLTGLAVGSTVQVRMVGYSVLGHRGDESPVSSITVEGVMLVDVDAEISDAIQDAQGAAAQAQSTADGKVTISPNAPTKADGSGKPTGAIWWRSEASTGNVIGMWEWSGSAWVSRPMGAGAIAAGAVVAEKLAANVVDSSKLAAAVNADIQKGISDAAAAQSTANTAMTTANGKNKIIFSTSGASGTAYATGDVWFKKTGGLIVAQWEFVSGAWQPRVLDNAVIANLDAGKITAGTLDAARIAANAITASKLASDSVTAVKIASEAVVAGKIATNAVTAGTIAANAITAREIVAGAITAASGILADASVGSAQIADAAVTNAKIANLDAGKITAGTLDAARIGASSINVQKLMVSNFNNLADDPSFEAGGAWTLSSTTTRVQTAPRTGAWHLQVVTTGSLILQAGQLEALQVEEGQVYEFSFWARTASGTSPVNTVGAAIRYGNTASVSTGITTGGVTNGRPALTTEYQQVRSRYTVGAGIKFIRPEIRIEPGATGTIYVDDAILVRRVDGSLIVDGAVTADTIAANAVTSEKIAADAVTANSIKAGAIDGMVITGATVRTAASGQRVQLDSGGLKAYNAAGAVTGQLMATSGGLTLSGTMRSGSGNQRVEVVSDRMRFYDSGGVSSGHVVAYNGTPGQASTAGVSMESSGSGAVRVGRNSYPDAGSYDVRLEGGVYADSDLRAGSIRSYGDIDGPNTPLRMAAGQVAVVSTIAHGTGVTASVTFPAGRFSVAPIVTATPGGSARLSVAVLAVSTTGCTIRIDNFSGGTASGITALSWMAVQMTSGSASG